MAYNPLFVYIGAGALLLGAVSGYKVRDWQCDAAAKEAAEEALEKSGRAQDEVDTSATEYEDFKEGYGEGYNTHSTRIKEIYREVHVPADCVVPDAVVRVLKDRVRAANAARTGQPSGPVPGSAEPTGPDDRPSAQ